jgi:hypothetical protein
VSAPARHLHAAPPAAAPGPVLVPRVGDAGPRIQAAPATSRRVSAYRVFCGMWYASLAMFTLAAWIGAVHFEPSLALNVIGGLFAALGGLGILIHTLCKRSEQKLRHALAAGAALALTISSLAPVGDVSTQVYATSRAARLQPVAEALARDGRIRNVGGTAERPRLNGAGASDAAVTLPEVLTRDGLTRAELQPYLEGLRRAGMIDAERTQAAVLFTSARVYDFRLLYVLPGQPLPDVRGIAGASATWRSNPLGGGWYVLLPD